MKFEDLVKNEEYRKRVIKLFQLPIRKTSSYNKFMNYMDFLYNTDNIFYEIVVTSFENDFIAESLRQKTSEPDMSMDYIAEKISKEISSTPGWEKFTKEDYSGTLDDYEGVTNIHGLYNKNNNGKYFLSVDLVSANWQSMQKITGIEKSYQDMVKKHTDNLSPIFSKSMRAKTTSLLDAKKIMDYNKYLLKSNKDLILKFLSTDKVNLQRTPFAFYADEFLIELTKEEFENLPYLTSKEKEILDKFGVSVHLRKFKLTWLNLNKSCIKDYGGYGEILNLSSDIKLMVAKRILNVKLDDVDFENVKHEKELVQKVDEVAELLKKIHSSNYS